MSCGFFVMLTRQLFTLRIKISFADLFVVILKVCCVQFRLNPILSEYQPSPHTRCDDRYGKALVKSRDKYFVFTHSFGINGLYF